ncbi:hypothetical protein NDI76_03425 [Halogeometricum sp. S1BR25-6]|uniref:Uncharacterized protein n=1 Tax=Halogeometricum salsisoli TaxID=2950536 RepID=A0ABU2GAE1_9EURY|nr:hypothetical protein [Halogeometricum sp. S1BR25-6]MDS0297783.1 hypothetical protein [Halogeometricum sp. S1BR25-6]
MSGKQLTDSVGEVFDLVRKSEGIISTFSANEVAEEPQTVEAEYERFADTHISLGDTDGFEDRVYESLVNNEKPTKGYLYGPFGYGKTSTSVSIWKEITDNDVIAVPPFTLTSFTAIMRATHGWMRYELSNKAPGYVDELEEIKDRYINQELEAYAEKKKDEYQFQDKDQLVEMFHEMERNNDLDLSIQADTLIDFFSECTDLALRADFDGLLVLGDEFQQYFKSADNRQDAESRFRNLVFGLQAGAKVQDEFGLFISMPEQTKSTLDAHAGDVLNRLERDNLTLNLKNVYGKDFPSELWDRYAQEYRFADRQHDVISQPALKAIGEICSREDLSNGPRTVIDIFRIAIKQYQTAGECFTVLDLADAFYEGEVRYQGSSTKIQSAIQDALDHSIVDSEKKSQFIRICAVFPEEGIPDSVVESWGLREAREDLSKALHGEVIKVVAEGYTLIDVTAREGPDDIVQQLIRDFWRQYDTEHVNATYAMEAFANDLVCGEIFEPIRGKLRGWGVGDGLNNYEPTLYKRSDLRGTFNTRYPKRIASLTATDPAHEEEIGNHDDLGKGYGTPDIAFNFVMGWESEENPVTPRIERESEREYTFIVNGRKTFDSLPETLDFLRDAMDPNAVTPFLMLALVAYLEQDDTEMDAQEENLVEHFSDKLLSVALKSLFDEELIDNAPFELQRAGKRAVEGVFTEAMQEIYPEYHTIITSTQYETMMDDYLDFLSALETTSKRRGSNTVEGTKKDIAALFGLKNTSPFDGRISQHYSDILTVEDSDSDNFIVRADLHPLEEEILNRLEKSNGEQISIQEIDKFATKYGYREEEVDVILQFLQQRGLVEKADSDAALTLLETDVSIGDVQTTFRECKKLHDAVISLDADFMPEGVTEELDAVEGDLEEAHPDDGEKLESLQVSARHVRERLAQQVESLHQRYLSECQDVEKEANRERRRINPDHLDDPIEGSVEFVGVLDDARRELRAEYQDIKQRIGEISDDLETAVAQYDEPTIGNTKQLYQKSTDARAELDEIRKEVSESDDGKSLEDLADAVERWGIFADQVANVRRKIMDYARTFEEDVDEAEQIENFIGQVSEHFTNDWEAALQNREGFEEQLDRIEESYEARRANRREVFQKKLEILKSILDEATGGSSRGLRRAQYPFIENPDEARRGLVEDFEEEYRSQVIEKASEMLTKAFQEIEYARIVGVDSGADADPNEVGERIEHTEAKVSSLESKLSRFTFTDIQNDSELCSELGNEGQTVLESAQELREASGEFRRESEPDNKAVQELLERINDHRQVDFKELLMEYHEDGEDLSPDELLSRMDQLFKHNQIDIQIARRRGR